MDLAGSRLVMRLRTVVFVSLYLLAVSSLEVMFLNPPAFAQAAVPASDTTRVDSTVQAKPSSGARFSGMFVSVIAPYYIIDNNAGFVRDGTLELEGYTLRIPAVQNAFGAGGSVGFLFTKGEPNRPHWTIGAEGYLYVNHGYYSWRDTTSSAFIQNLGILAWGAPPWQFLVFRPEFGLGGHVVTLALDAAASDSAGRRYDATFTMFGLHVFGGVQVRLTTFCWLSARGIFRGSAGPGVDIDGTSVHEFISGEIAPTMLDLTLGVYAAIEL